MSRLLTESDLHTLDLFVRADASVAHLSVPTVGAICPGEVASHAHQMAIRLSCAPQTATWWLHEGTGLGALSKRELTLAFQDVGCPWQQVREDKWFLRLVEQTFA